jgi:TRAP-type C4-dicarboxylate transport system permease small subunit
MTFHHIIIDTYRALSAGFSKILRGLVFLLAIISGAGIITMMAVTCLDIILRIFRYPLAGAFDIVKIAGAVTIAAALPYTTAVKGHVAIEYFFHKLSKRYRIITDTFIRLLGIGMFFFICRQSIIYATALKKSGQVTLTLQLPVYWILYFIAFSCALVALVIFYNLLHPGKEMIKP